MLDAFLSVAYDHETRHTENVKLAKILQALPMEDLQKLATGEAKLAFGPCSPMGSGECWIDKFKGTPLFDQALQLEKAELEAEVARTQAQAAAPSWDEMNRTQDHIRVQKKMLDLELLEMENGQARGVPQPMSVESAQGAGAPGDAGPDAEPQKVATAFEKAAISGKLIDKAVVNTIAAGKLSPERVAKAKALGEKVLAKGSKMVGSFDGAGRIARGNPKGLPLVRQGAHMSELMGKLSSGFAQAAFQLAKANPKLVGAGLGAGLGAVGGAIAGGPDHRLSGALGGAALGGAAGGIGGQMVGGKSLLDLDAAHGAALPASVMKPGRNNVMQMPKAAAFRFLGALQALEA